MHHELVPSASDDRRVEPPRSVVSADDLALCRALLPEVSRTFALSIAALPAPLADAVLAAYLLCRIVDTIEDEPATHLAPATRDALFDRLAMTLVDPLCDPSDLERACAAAALGGESADGRLCRNAGAVFRLFRALPHAQQRQIRPRVLIMLEGMRSYCHSAAAEGSLQMRDLEDVERYCYYVAGTVGRLLTDLFCGFTGRLEPAARRRIHDHAVSFGVGLQLVNMVKDVAEDLSRGVCFLPLDLLAAQAVPRDQLLAPARRADALVVVRAVCARARAHLARAARYTLSWPLPAGAPVRRFCLVPLALALATLSEVEAGRATLRADVTPKVSRAAVAALLVEVTGAAEDDARLRALLRRARRTDLS